MAKWKWGPREKIPITKKEALQIIHCCPKSLRAKIENAFGPIISDHAIFQESYRIQEEILANDEEFQRLGTVVEQTEAKWREACSARYYYRGKIIPERDVLLQMARERLEKGNGR